MVAVTKENHIPIDLSTRCRTLLVCGIRWGWRGSINCKSIKMIKCKPSWHYLWLCSCRQTLPCKYFVAFLGKMPWKSSFWDAATPSVFQLVKKLLLTVEWNPMFDEVIQRGLCSHSWQKVHQFHNRAEDYSYSALLNIPAVVKCGSVGFSETLYIWSLRC